MAGKVKLWFTYLTYWAHRSHNRGYNSANLFLLQMNRYITNRHFVACYVIVDPSFIIDNFDKISIKLKRILFFS